ncbi:MAG: nuclear transport factor 2 family protein [Gemmatimonas sp.]
MTFTTAMHSLTKCSRTSKDKMDARYEAIVQLLAQYFEGLYNSDSALLSRVFHAQAQYVCPTENALVQRTMAEYFPIIDARPSPASRGEVRHDRIVSIEFGGPTLVFVRAECAIGPKFFTDFLTIIRTEERWQIISKVFHFDLRS